MGREEEHREASAIGRLQASLVRYLEARFRLVQFETRQAAGHGIGLAVLALAAVLFAVLGWVLLLTGGIALLAPRLDWPWPYLALAAAGLHLLVAAVFWLLFFARKNRAMPGSDAASGEDS